MSSRRSLERDLERVDGFDDPRIELEQYATPATVAASIIHEADLRGDLARTVVDLGAGTGRLAIGAAMRTDRRIIGLEVDRDALVIARSNAQTMGVDIAWVHGDVASEPIDPDDPVTVLMNPPFGAQTGHRGADRTFLRTAADMATVSYSIHNAGSQAFLEAFVDDHDGRITHRYRATVALAHQFDFHREASTSIAAEVVRIAWA